MIKTNTKIRTCKLIESLFILYTNKAQDFPIIIKEVQNTWQKLTWEILHVRLVYLRIDRIKNLSKITMRFENFTKVSIIFLLTLYFYQRSMTCFASAK